MTDERRGIAPASSGRAKADERYRESEIGLPTLFTLRGFEGSVSEYIDALHAQYVALLQDPHVLLWGKPLAVWGREAPDGRDEAFWHIITSSSGVKGATRCLDLVRCARLPWVSEMIRMLGRGDPRVCWWLEAPRSPSGRSKGSDGAFVTTVDFRHVVNLRVAGNRVVLGTAYPVGGRSRRRWMKRAAQSWLTAEPGEWRDRGRVSGSVREAVLA